MSVAEIGIGAISPVQAADPATLTISNASPVPGGKTFADMLVDGFDRVEASVRHANDVANAFVLDDNIPVHQVTYALEEARMSLEFALQFRNRLTEAYQQVMGMQL